MTFVYKNFKIMKNQYNKKYSLNVLDGMTVSERLYYCDLFNEFDDAIKMTKKKLDKF